MFAKLKSFLRDDDSGQALVEFALIFPLQLIFTFGLMQLMFLMISSLMVNYAAFRVARVAALHGCDHPSGRSGKAINIAKGNEGALEAPCEVAASIILSPLAWTDIGCDDRVDVPGWGGMRGTDDAVATVEARRHSEGGFGAPVTVTVKVVFYQELIFPFVDNLFMYFGGGRRVMAKGTLRGAKGTVATFPIAATSIARAAPFDVSPGANCYDYEPVF